MGQPARRQRLFRSQITGLVGDRSRPKPASRIAPKQPDGQLPIFLFRFYNVGFRDLTHPATSGYSDMASLGRPDPARCGGFWNWAADGTPHELRRRAVEHCGYPGAACDRQDLHVPEVAVVGTAARAGPRSIDASGLTSPIHQSSCGPAPRAAGLRSSPQGIPTALAAGTRFRACQAALGRSPSRPPKGLHSQPRPMVLASTLRPQPHEKCV